MAGNKALIRAKREKNDEFMTRIQDVDAEMQAYLAYDPDVFRGATIFCPCDEPERSAFPRWFREHAAECGIARVLSSAYRKGGRGVWEDWTPDACTRGEWEGDGDFRSPEVTAWRRRADFIITNPPFSLFREFMAWVWEGEQESMEAGAC